MKSETITIRTSPETADRFKGLWLAGAHSNFMKSAFARYIFHIGLERYEKAFFPVETGKEYNPAPEGKIIPFPGQG